MLRERGSIGIKINLRLIRKSLKEWSMESIIKKGKGLFSSSSNILKILSITISLRQIGRIKGKKLLDKSSSLAICLALKRIH